MGLTKPKLVWGLEGGAETHKLLTSSFVLCPNLIKKTQTLLPVLLLACVDAALDIISAILRNKIPKN